MNKTLPSCYKSFEEREARLIYMRSWHAANRERQNKKSAEYQLAHPEIHRKASRKYAAARRISQTPSALEKTATWIGRRAELAALRLLPGSKDLNGEVMNHPGYDLIWEGQRVDVKSGKPFWRRGSPQWAFQKMGKGHSACDLYLCLAFENGSLQRAFLIPHDDYNEKGVTVGKHSKKYARFQLSLS